MAKRVSAQARDAARRNTRMRFEQWAKNPACEANTISAVRNVRMIDVAKAKGIPAKFGQSPFAVARGDQFERSLFYNDAERLLTELKRKELLPKSAAGLIDLRIRMNGGKHLTTLDEAIEETSAFIQRVADTPRVKRNEIPAIAAGATVQIPRGVLLPEATLIIDVLAVRMDDDRPSIYVGEVKTYPDRGGHTGSVELATARAQAGIYIHGLDLVVDSLGLGNAVEVRRDGFLVLTKPGSNYLSVRVGEELGYQAERAKRGFELLERAAAALSKDLWAHEGEELPATLVDAVMKADKAYCENCLAFCELASHCFEQARSRGDSIILGEDVRRLLGQIDLNRAVQLLDGAEPDNEAEQDLVLRIRALDGVVK